MAKQSKLEQIAINIRKEILIKNTYNNFDPKNTYTAAHTRAKSDEETPINGKGTGLFLDVENGGSSIDTYGVPHVANSGRAGNVSNNIYNKNNKYEHPDTSGNIGQVQI